MQIFGIELLILCKYMYTIMTFYVVNLFTEIQIKYNFFFMILNKRLNCINLLQN